MAPKVQSQAARNPTQPTPPPVAKKTPGVAPKTVAADSEYSFGPPVVATLLPQGMALPRAYLFKSVASTDSQSADNHLPPISYRQGIDLVLQLLRPALEALSDEFVVRKWNDPDNLDTSFRLPYLTTLERVISTLSKIDDVTPESSGTAVDMALSYAKDFLSLFDRASPVRQILKVVTGALREKFPLKHLFTRLELLKPGGENPWKPAFVETLTLILPQPVAPVVDLGAESCGEETIFAFQDDSSRLEGEFLKSMGAEVSEPFVQERPLAGSRKAVAVKKTPEVDLDASEEGGRLFSKEHFLKPTQELLGLLRKLKDYFPQESGKEIHRIMDALKNANFHKRPFSVDLFGRVLVLFRDQLLTVESYLSLPPLTTFIQELLNNPEVQRLVDTDLRASIEAKIVEVSRLHENCLYVEDVAKILELTAGGIRSRVARKTIPEPSRQPGGRLFWMRDGIMPWLEQRAAESTAQVVETGSEVKDEHGHSRKASGLFFDLGEQGPQQLVAWNEKLLASQTLTRKQRERVQAFNQTTFHGNEIHRLTLTNYLKGLIEIYSQISDSSLKDEIRGLAQKWFQERTFNPELVAALEAAFATSTVAEIPATVEAPTPALEVVIPVAEVPAPPASSTVTPTVVPAVATPAAAAPVIVPTMAAPAAAQTTGHSQQAVSADFLSKLSDFNLWLSETGYGNIVQRTSLGVFRSKWPKNVESFDPEQFKNYSTLLGRIFYELPEDVRVEFKERLKPLLEQGVFSGEFAKMFLPAQETPRPAPAAPEIQPAPAVVAPTTSGDPVISSMRLYPQELAILRQFNDYLIAHWNELGHANAEDQALILAFRDHLSSETASDALSQGVILDYLTALKGFYFRVPNCVEKTAMAIGIQNILSFPDFPEDKVRPLRASYRTKVEMEYSGAPKFSERRDLETRTIHVDFPAEGKTMACELDSREFYVLATLQAEDVERLSILRDQKDELKAILQQLRIWFLSGELRALQDYRIVLQHNEEVFAKLSRVATLYIQANSSVSTAELSRLEKKLLEAGINSIFAKEYLLKGGSLGMPVNPADAALRGANLAKELRRRINLSIQKAIKEFDRKDVLSLDDVKEIVSTEVDRFRQIIDSDTEALAASSLSDEDKELELMIKYPDNDIQSLRILVSGTPPQDYRVMIVIKENKNGEAAK